MLSTTNILKISITSVFSIVFYFTGNYLHNSGNRIDFKSVKDLVEVDAQSTAILDEKPFVIDVNVGLGRFTNGIGADFPNTESSLEHLDKEGVGTAVIYSVLSRESDAEEGNAIVMEEYENHPELIPSSVINPYETNLEEALADMDKYNIQIVRLFPVVGHYSVYPSIIGPVVSKLQEANKILFIDFEAGHWSSDAINYDGVFQLSQAYPEIPIVLIGPTITGTRNYVNLLRECENVYLEISQMFQPEEVYRLVKKGYGKRLIFGSDFPIRKPGALINMLLNSGLSQDELNNIFSQNILNLLEKPSASKSFSMPDFEDEKIIDLHVHQGKINPTVTGTEKAEDIVRNMDRCGITAGIVTSMWSIHGDVARGNKAVSEACAAYPDRLYGYITLDPKYPEEVKSQLELYGDNPSFRGIKLHAIQGVDISDPRHDIIFSFADKKGWVLLCHASNDYRKWDKICANYRNANFLIAHSGTGDPKVHSVLQLAELTKKHKNLYFDTAGSGMPPMALERLVEVAGVDHVTYGSDYPMFDFSYETGRILYSSLTKKEKNAILYENGRKLLGL
ncbi:amidohydrolase family protein [Membranihabitans marinus]|uniref:amidohydrolase family protein n=1 Tax=Membranihabitans marinus TaxID=1227546 RepID=UPI001F1B48FD|nr:amidohydrolase family protein [Membranihabitans marinus]